MRFSLFQFYSHSYTTSILIPVKPIFFHTVENAAEVTSHVCSSVIIQTFARVYVEETVFPVTNERPAEALLQLIQKTATFKLYGEEQQQDQRKSIEVLQNC